MDIELNLEIGSIQLLFMNMLNCAQDLNDMRGLSKLYVCSSRSTGEIQMEILATSYAVDRDQVEKALEYSF